MRQKADHAHAHHRRGERSHACLIDHPHWRGQPHAVCPPIPLLPQRGRPRQVGLPRPPRPLPRPKLSPALARESKPRVKVPAAAEAAPVCSRWSPASWAPASSLPRIDGMLKLRLILLLNEGRRSAQQTIARQGSAQWQRERSGRVAAGWVEAWQLTRHDNSSNWKMSAAVVGKTRPCRLRGGWGHAPCSRASKPHQNFRSAACTHVVGVRPTRQNPGALPLACAGRASSQTWLRGQTSHSRPPPTLG